MMPFRQELAAQGEQEDSKEDDGAPEVAHVHRHREPVAPGFSQGSGRDLHDPEPRCNCRELVDEIGLLLRSLKAHDVLPESSSPGEHTDPAENVSVALRIGSVEAVADRTKHEEAPRKRLHDAEIRFHKLLSGLITEPLDRLL